MFELLSQSLNRRLKSVDDLVANRPLPCDFYISFKLFKISGSGFSTVSMHRRFRTYEIPTTVTKGVIHCIHRIVIWSYYGEIR